MIYHNAITLDFETSGSLPEYALQPWRPRDQFWVTSLAAIEYEFSGSQKIHGGLDPTREMMAAILGRAIIKKRRIICWNALFDISVFMAYGLEDLCHQVKWLDGMLLWRHAEIEPEYDMDRSRRKSFGLKACVQELWPHIANYEEGVDFHDTSPEAREKLHNYNISDVTLTYSAAAYWWEKLSSRQQRAALIESDCLSLVASANFRGMKIDTLAAKELSQLQSNIAKDRLEELAPLGMTEEIVRSPAKLAALMFDDWGLEPLKQTRGAKTGKLSRSTDKETLHELSFGDRRVKAIREYREALNAKTKFAEALTVSANYNGDGHSHPLAHVFGTYTGRITYSSKQGRNKDERPIGFAIHQTKRDKKFRAPIIAPKGYSIMEFDAAGQEFRWMAIASKDPTMLSLCLPGEDPHSFMGSRIAPEWEYRALISAVKAGNKEAENVRKSGKVGNLSLQYRTRPPRFTSTARVDYGIDMNLKQGEHICRVYLNTYKGVPNYWNNQITNTKKSGYVETMAGRQVQVIGDWTGKMRWSMESTSINYPIQGTGAEQKYLAIACVKDYVLSIGGKFLLDMHDGLYWLIPDDKVKEAAIKIKNKLDNLPYKQAWGLVPPIPLPWDCKVGTSWGNLKDFQP